MYFDLLLLFLVCLTAVFGYIHGFVRQIISLLSMLTILFFAQPLALWLKNGSEWPWFENAPQLALFGMSSFIIILFYLAVSGIVYLIRKGSGLTKADRWIGCALGAAKGIIIALLISLGIHLLPEHAQNRFDELRADTQDSIFMKAAKPMLEWKSLSTFKSLHDIKDYLRAPEKKFAPKNGPWAQGEGVESE